MTLTDERRKELANKLKKAYTLLSEFIDESGYDAVTVSCIHGENGLFPTVFIHKTEDMLFTNISGDRDDFIELINNVEDGKEDEEDGENE